MEKVWVAVVLLVLAGGCGKEPAKEKALEEMTDGPFGFHSVWRGLPKFIRELDVEKLREELELGSRGGGSGP